MGIQNSLIKNELQKSKKGHFFIRKYRCIFVKKILHMSKEGWENRKHIGFFGRCNVGKSSLVNALAGQKVSIVSEQSGTTTDAVRKAIELKEIGAAVLIDTAGLDDKTTLGAERKSGSREVLKQVDMAVLMIGESGFGDLEREFLADCKSLSIPCLTIYNRKEHENLDEGLKREIETEISTDLFCLYGYSESELSRLTARIAALLSENKTVEKTPLSGIVGSGDTVLLVCPIDSSAPKGRMILAQVQTIRDCLDKSCVCVVVKESELKTALNVKGIKPDLVVTDSQVFHKVKKIVPCSIPLTSFSVLLARSKGLFTQYLEGTPHLDKLNDGDKVLILESCTHQPTCQDIGRVKLPRLIAKHSGRSIVCTTLGGNEPIEGEVSDYAMVIQCGGCVATSTRIRSRLMPFVQKGIPVSNYGLAIAYMNGIFERATEIFREKEDRILPFGEFDVTLGD